MTASYIVLLKNILLCDQSNIIIIIMKYWNYIICTYVINICVMYINLESTWLWRQQRWWERWILVMWCSSERLHVELYVGKKRRKKKNRTCLFRLIFHHQRIALLSLSLSLSVTQNNLNSSKQNVVVCDVHFNRRTIQK